MKTLKIIYLNLFIVGSVVPAYFFIQFLNEQNLAPSEFGKAIFASNPASNFSSQVLISCLVFFVFMFADPLRKKTPNMIWFIILTFAVGLSSSLPLYLYFREKNKVQNE